MITLSAEGRVQTKFFLSSSLCDVLCVVCNVKLPRHDQTKPSNLPFLWLYW